MDKKSQFLEAMQFRHACKVFADRKIQQADLEFILEAGRLSPSSFGIEQWKFVVVQNEALKKSIEAVAWNQKQVTTCSDLVVILARKDVRSSDVYVQNQLGRWGLDKDAYAGLLGLYKNWVDGRDDHTLEMWSEKQCYLAAANMMSAAAFIGIDSCPIEGFLSDKVDEILGIDRNVYQSAIVIPFGYRINEGKGKCRLAFKDVVEFKK